MKLAELNSEFSHAQLFGVENAENRLGVIQVKTLDVKKLFPFASDIEEVPCIRAIGNVS